MSRLAKKLQSVMRRRAAIIIAIVLLLNFLFPILRTFYLYGIALAFQDFDSIYIRTNILDLHYSQNSSNSVIPRIIHQTWRSHKGIPEHWKKAIKSCKNHNPNYEFRFWTDMDLKQFIDTHYSWFYPTFSNYRYPIQRVDAARYFILYHYGGVYLDLDIGCRRSLDFILLTNMTAVFPKTSPVGVSNDFMAAAPKHPFFKFLTQQLQIFDHSYILPYLTIFFSTGPAFLTSGLYWGAKNDVAILPANVYSNHSNPNMFFYHTTGNSWHSWDVEYYKWLYHNLTWIIMGCVFFILQTGIFIFYRTFKRYKPYHSIE